LAVSVARVIWRDSLAKIADTKIIGIDWHSETSGTIYHLWLYYAVIIREPSNLRKQDLYSNCNVRHNDT
jgi:hypothetical protein